MNLNRSREDREEQDNMAALFVREYPTKNAAMVFS
jgi:hypothetical protein